MQFLMAITLRLKHLSRSHILCLLLGSLLSFQAVGQSEMQLIVRKKIKTPSAVSVDRNADFYIADSQGNIDRYDKDGTFLINYSPEKIGAVTSLETWSAMRIFAFYQDFQEYQELNRFLTPTTRGTFDNDALNFISVGTPSADNQLWLVDESDLSLKKYHPQKRTVSIETPFGLMLSGNSYKINHIREYQNLLFLAEEHTGIIIFDNLGNYIKTLPAQSVKYFNFDGNKIYYLEKNAAIFTDIYTLDKDVLPLQIKAQYVLKIEKRLILFQNSSFSVFKLP